MQAIINYRNNRHIRNYIFLHLLAISFASCLHSQSLQVVKETKKYLEMVVLDSNYKLLEVKSVIADVVYDIRYATEKNFTSKQLYKSGDKTFLLLPVVKALDGVQKELTEKGYGLKIFDAYRPYSVTKEMWDLIKDERYVANPAKGSGHNKGLAVDVTIIDLETGKELDMGTGYDNFSDTAHHDYKNLSEKILNNRELLKTVMIKHGFNPLTTEWWHYSWKNDRNYPVLDLSFRQLEQLQY